MSEHGNTLYPVPPGRVVRLWRIEHPADQVGPFFEYGRPAQVQGVRKSHLDDWVHPINMPGPNQDKKLRDYHAKGNLYAFPTAKALLQWFSGWTLMRLTSLGYVVRLFAVPWSRHTRYQWQARFYRNEAVVLHEMSPASVMWCAGAPTDVPARWNTDAWDY